MSDFRRAMPAILCALLIMLGLVAGQAVSAIITSSAVRSAVGALAPAKSGASGGAAQGEAAQAGAEAGLGALSPEVMDVSMLIEYLRLEDAVQPEDLQGAILNGDWTDFPYVQLHGQMYFSKSAVDGWFEEKSRQRLIVG